MLKKLFFPVLGLALLLGFFVMQAPLVSSAPESITYEFDMASDYSYPSGSVEFVTISGDTVARRGDPDTVPCSYVQNKEPIPFDSIYSFNISHTQFGGSAPFNLVKVLMSYDGDHWYDYNWGTSTWDWVDVSSSCGFGEGDAITNAMMSEFTDDFGPGMFYFRAYMSDADLGGGSYVVPIIDNVVVQYYAANECVEASDCGTDQYCKKPAEMCSAVGVCSDQPAMCPMILSQVCGCDGVTYSNSCTAAVAGIAVEHAGACPAATCTDGIMNQDETDVDCGGVCSACATTTGTDFVDVPAGHPHAHAIQTLKDIGVISGYDPTHFGPDLPLRRGELLKIALNGAGINTDSYLYASNPYSDLPDDHTLKQFILYAYHNDIATGYGDGRFGPDNYSTQAEATKMILNVNDIEQLAPPSGVTYGLPPGDLRNFVHAAMEMNLLYNAAGFVSNNAITRGYAAEIMYRILWINNSSSTVYDE